MDKLQRGVLLDKPDKLRIEWRPPTQLNKTDQSIYVYQAQQLVTTALLGMKCDYARLSHRLNNDDNNNHNNILLICVPYRMKIYTEFNFSDLAQNGQIQGINYYLASLTL